MRQEDGSIEVIVERFVAFGLQSRRIDVIGLRRGFQCLEAFEAFQHALKGLFGAL